MTDAVFVGIVVAVVGAVLTFVGSMMVRSNNRNADATGALEVKIDAQSAEMARLVTEVALQGNNHGHVMERLVLVEQSTRSAHQRLDLMEPRLVRVEVYRDQANPEVRGT